VLPAAAEPVVPSSSSSPAVEVSAPKRVVTVRDVQRVTGDALLSSRALALVAALPLTAQLVLAILAARASSIGAVSEPKVGWLTHCCRLCGADCLLCP
jgi:hypothetical protein